MTTQYRIESVAVFGDLIVYRRCWQEAGLRKYAVYRDSDGRILEEFKRLVSALKWAKTNGGAQ